MYKNRRFMVIVFSILNCCSEKKKDPSIVYIEMIIACSNKNVLCQYELRQCSYLVKYSYTESMGCEWFYRIVTAVWSDKEVRSCNSLGLSFQGRMPEMIFCLNYWRDACKAEMKILFH
jgi:hypothetical protein